jgi:hypothetical protein
MVDDLFSTVGKAQRSVEILLELGGSAADSLVDQAALSIVHVVDASLRTLSNGPPAGTDPRQCGMLAASALYTLLRSRMLGGDEKRKAMEYTLKHIRMASAHADPRVQVAKGEHTCTSSH